MKVKVSRNRTAAAVEYFLYSIILLETCIAALSYKAIVQFAQLSLLTRAYLVLLYFGVLAWVFFHLNRLHRRRKQRDRKITPVTDPSPSTAAQTSELQTSDQTFEVHSEVPQPIAPVQAQAGAPPVAAEAVAAGLFGLTRAQLAIVLVVFLAALKAFSWALATLIKP
ncbi:MAG TPA: hypothetical protein VKX49_19275 [Bryobacteraceae bacterium]|nr:hypothetical protein [Bryobacteraceae bacterium]